jgi:hypothetical protein
VHPNLIAALAEDRRKSCPCGGVARQLHSPCRKCRTRLAWRRHTRRPPWGVRRRSVDRQTRASAWVVAAATSVLRVIGKEARS